MKSILLILFVFFQLSAFCQSSFEFLYPTESDYICSDLIATPDQNYVLCLLQVNVPVQELILAKVNEDGALLQTQQITPSVENVVYYKVVQLTSGYIVFGVQNAPGVTNSNLYFLIIDNNFQLLSSGSIITDLPETSSRHLLQIKHDVAGNILVLGTKLSGGGNYLSAFTPDGIFQYLKTGFPFNSCGTIFDFCPTADDQYTCVSTGSVCVVDSTLNTVTYAGQEPFSMQSTCLFLPDENAVYVAGRHSQPFAPVDDRGVIVLKYDENLGHKGMAVIHAASPDTVIYPAISNSIQQRSNGEILVGGTWNIDYTTLSSSNKSYFFLTQLDTLLSILATRKFGGDAYYNMYGIKPTSDGGCVMYGYRYDEAGSTGLDPFVKKLGVDDLTLANNDLPNNPKFKGQISPNPGFDHITIQLPLSEGYLKITSMMGEHIVFYGMVKNNEIIQTLTWPEGCYIFQLFDKKGSFYQIDKWVKF